MRGRSPHSEPYMHRCGYIASIQHDPCTDISFGADPTCSGVVAPINGGWGTCARDGKLQTGNTCSLDCANGYELIGEQPFCESAVLANTVQCFKPNHTLCTKCNLHGTCSTGTELCVCIPGYGAGGSGSDFTSVCNECAAGYGGYPSCSGQLQAQLRPCSY